MGLRLSKCRAVFVTMSPLLSGIVRDLLSEKIGLDLIHQIGDREMLAERLPKLQPDLVVIELSNGEGEDIGRFILQVVPGAKVLAISSDGRDAYLHEMRLHRRHLLDFSPANLLSAIVAPDSPARE
jgi:DNA-binding NarL/FixJ family response regulator